MRNTRSAHAAARCVCARRARNISVVDTPGHNLGRLRGKFIVFDGAEGCGKSTQADMLCKSLADLGEQRTALFKCLRHPSQPPLGPMAQLLFEPSPLRVCGLDDPKPRRHSNRTTAYVRVGAGCR